MHGALITELFVFKFWELSTIYNPIEKIINWTIAIDKLQMKKFTEGECRPRFHGSWIPMQTKVSRKVNTHADQGFGDLIRLGGSNICSETIKRLRYLLYRREKEADHSVILFHIQAYQMEAVLRYSYKLQWLQSYNKLQWCKDVASYVTSSAQLRSVTYRSKLGETL